MTRHYYRSVLATLVVALLCGFAAPVFAQAPADDDDAKLRPLEPDFKITNLPTTLPMPVHGGAFELTHRFGGDFANTDFGTLAGNLFGLDNGATINLGYRFGLMKHLEVAVSRTQAFKEIQFQAKYDAFHEDQGKPVGLSAILSIEGDNNFGACSDCVTERSPAIGLSISRTLGSAAVVYVDPFWVHNSAGTGAPTVGTRDTGFVGLGTRVRLVPATFVTFEVSPRVGGYAPGTAMYAVAIEKRVGGHVFSLNFGNSTLGSTYGQIARGGSSAVPNGHMPLYMGFNLSRKFY
ncbi:MAG TPA: DUF5777 family beta-barrel protein [Vicinamibacterales bacterium]|nr:DUF5777 family beta-barrel protein [Vicinamibacterales bacterium]